MPSKSNFEHFIYFYFTILGTKQIAKVCQKQMKKIFVDLEKMFQKILEARKDLNF